MSAREHVFRLRLSDTEQAQLARRAKEENLAKADVIRKALGWEPEGLARPRSRPRGRLRKVPDLAPLLRCPPVAGDGPDNQVKEL